MPVSELTIVLRHYVSFDIGSLTYIRPLTHTALPLPVSLCNHDLLAPQTLHVSRGPVPSPCGKVTFHQVPGCKLSGSHLGCDFSRLRFFSCRPHDTIRCDLGALGLRSAPVLGDASRLADPKHDSLSFLVSRAGLPRGSSQALQLHFDGFLLHRTGNRLGS